MSLLFVSHRTCDDEQVNELAARLNDIAFKHGLNHIDGINAGDDIDLEIQNALNECEFGLVVYSNKTFWSPEVRGEIRQLLNTGKRVYVARIEEITPDTLIGGYLQFHM